MSNVIILQCAFLCRSSPDKTQLNIRHILRSANCINVTGTRDSNVQLSAASDKQRYEIKQKGTSRKSSTAKLKNRLRMLVWLIVSALSGISATEPTLHPQVGFIMNITRSNKLREGVQKNYFFSSLLLLRGEGVGRDVKELLSFFTNYVFVGVFQYDSGTPNML